MNNLPTYDLVEKFIIDSFTKINDTQGIKHLLRTVYWLKVLNPDADEELCVAAIAHDVERSVRNREKYDKIKNSDKGYMSDEHLAHHQEEGSRIIADFLKTQKVDNTFIERVKMLVSKHEVGGNDDQNLLKDADSLSFFENNVDHFIQKQIKETSKEKVKDKFDWMYNRITSQKAKDIAKKWYKDAIKKVE